MNTESNDPRGAPPAASESAEPELVDTASSPVQRDMDHGAEAEQAKKIADEGDVARPTASESKSGS